jgi:hypothetical protein
MMRSITRMPSGCRPGARPVEVCPSICAILNGQRGTRGRQRIAGPKSVSERQKARQFAACPEFFPDSFLSSLFPLVLPDRNAYKSVGWDKLELARRSGTEVDMR